jgi:nucleoside-diphosphate-sugar epimerase
VTGTSGLVGYQVALRLHEAGADVVGLDHPQIALADGIAELRRTIAAAA